MKNLVFAALLLGGLSQATGCIIVSDDDDDDSSTFLVSWDLQTGLVSDSQLQAITCADAGVASIRTVSRPAGGANIIDLFDCVDGQRETAPLPLGDYVVTTDALDASESVVAISSQTEETLFDGNPVGVTFAYPVDIAYFGLTWVLTQGGNTINCETGDGVSVLSTEVGGSGTGYDEIFDCVAGTGTTTVHLPLQQYTVSISLIDAQDTVLSQADPITERLDIGNEVVDLGNFEFDFTP